MLRSFVAPDGRVMDDTMVSSVARRVLRQEYILRPIGSDTIPELEDRIIGVFMTNYKLDWNRNVSPEDIIGDANFHQIVATVSPLSTRRPRPPREPFYDPYVAPEVQKSAMWPWLLGAGILVGGLFLFRPKKRKRGRR